MTDTGLESRKDSKIKVTTPTWPKLTTEWPTVFLFFAVIIVTTCSTVAAFRLPPSIWVVFSLINTVCVYSVFTVMHEASHRNISRRFSKSEYFMGLISGLMYHGSYDQFVVLHLRHHAKVNIPGEDPDLHAVGPLTVTRFLYWTTTLRSYMSFYWNNKALGKRGFAKTWLPYVFILTVYAAGFAFGFFTELVVLWLIPSALGVAFTTLVFDHLPHNPHKERGKYTNARSYPDKRIDWVLFMHSYHIVHHLWPSIPWYRYREAYIQRRDELQDAGNVETSLFSGSKAIKV